MNQPGGLETVFEARYGRKPRVFRAPGRVNIIGEHTDYNDGFVMPAAIQFATCFAAAARADPKLHVYSEKFCEAHEFDLDDVAAAAQGHWTDYVRGNAVTLERARYHLRGTDLVVRGNVPIGAGLRFRELVSMGYEKATGKKPSIYVTSAMDGAAEVALT